MHWPAVRADVSKIAAFRRASQVKKHGVGVEKANIMGGKPSVEEGMAETPIIHMCLISRIHERAGCLRNRVFCGHFKTFVNCGFPASAKKTSMS
jgi:hypothetical protein